MFSDTMIVIYKECEIWDKLAQDHDYCLTLVDSISRRSQLVIDAGGMWTRYYIQMLLFFVYFKLLSLVSFLKKKKDF